MLTLTQSYAVVGLMFALNVALYGWMFARARRDNRRRAAIRRVLDFPIGGRR